MIINQIKEYYLKNQVIESLYKRLFIPFNKIENIDLLGDKIKYVYTKLVKGIDTNKEDKILIGIYSIKDIPIILLVKDLYEIIYTIKTFIKGKIEIEYYCPRLNIENEKRLNLENIKIVEDNLELINKYAPDLENLIEINNLLKVICKDEIRILKVWGPEEVFSEGIINPSNRIILRLKLKTNENKENIGIIDILGNYSSGIKELNCYINTHYERSKLFIKKIDTAFKSILIKIDEKIRIKEKDIIEYCKEIEKNIEEEYTFIDYDIGKELMSKTEIDKYTHYIFLKNEDILSSTYQIKNINE
ncbi:hypothetical protein V6O07_04920 [Arthrospira platensis SPKY2]